MRRCVDILVAGLAALVCHGGFLVAVTAMAVGLATGMQSSWGRVPEPWNVPANALLVLQFPLLHSLLLHRRGRRLLTRVVPGSRGRTLAPTTFAAISSLQLILVFLAWTPMGVAWFAPHGAWKLLAFGAFGASWLFLLRALVDAGLGLQTGSLGWWALLRGRPPRYPGLPTGGVFRQCRQPIYLAFFLILWTAPTWTPDHLILALAWSPYCLLAPRLKEQRFLSTFGVTFSDYRERVPYMFPALLSKHHRDLFHEDCRRR